MKRSKTVLDNSVKFITAVLILLSFFLSVVYLSPVNAQSSTNQIGSRNLTPTNPDHVPIILDTLAKSSCPDAIKQLYLKKDPKTNTWTARDDVIKQQLYLDGTLIVAREGTNYVNLSCANATTLEKIAMRIFVLIFSIVGLVLAFGVGKSTITMMTAFGDRSKFEEGVRGLVTSITYSIGALFFYIIFVFVLVGMLGFGRAVKDKPEYNLFCQQTIVFQLTFDQYSRSNQNIPSAC